MRNLLSLLVILTLFSSFAYGQKWKRERVEYSLGLGVTNFLGDLGGANQIGTNGLRDLEIKAMRYSTAFGYRYRVTKMVSVKGNFIYAKVSGSDAFTEEPGRHQRGLSFKSSILELSGQAEISLIKPKSSGALYRLKGVGGKNGLSFEVYAFLGAGGIWYHPRAERDGKSYALRPLHTEGQGLPGGSKQYSGFSIVVPYGIGIKKSIGQAGNRFSPFSISLEISMRKTFTDYIDDVSGYYYGRKFITAAYGEIAGYFADPTGFINEDHTQYGEPQLRGDQNDNDAYLLGVLSLNYKITKRRRNLPKF